MGSADKIGTNGGMVILAGIFIIMIGIIANGKAGLVREKYENSGTDHGITDSNKMRNGIILCIIGLSIMTLGIAVVTYGNTIV